MYPFRTCSTEFMKVFSRANFWGLITTITIFVFLSCVSPSLAIDVDKELTLTLREKQALDETLQWREDYRMDSILDEDWSFYEDKYFIDDTGTDYSGRPVLAVDISEWDVREAVVSGQSERLVRYMFKSLESVSKRVRDLQAQGKNVTQWQVILNLDNFNLYQHGCLQCLPIYYQFISGHESYYPFGADRIIAINTPAVFDIVLRLVRPVMSPAMRDSLQVFGTNRIEWRKFLLNSIPEEELPRHFGGTKSI